MYDFYFSISIVILLNKEKKSENTNHSYEGCVNEYDKFSSTLFLSFSILVKKCLSTRKETVISHTHSLSFSSNVVIVFFDVVIVQKRNITIQICTRIDCIKRSKTVQ
jgi:hypothetical protein